MWVIKWLLLVLIYIITNSKIRTAKNPLLVYLAIFIVFISAILFFSLFASVLIDFGTELGSASLIRLGQFIVELTTFRFHY